MSWQRRIRIGLVLFAAAFVIVLALSLRPRPTSTEIVPEREDPRAIVESGPGVTVSTEGGDEDFHIKYGRMFQYDDGTTRFLEIEVELPPRDGKVMTLSGDEAIVEARDDAARAAATPRGGRQETVVRGNVRLASSEGFEAQAAEAVYTQPDEIVRVPGEVTFTRGRMSGRSEGARYDIGRDVLSLIDAPRIVIAAEAPGGEASDIRARTAEVAQGERRIQLTDNVEMARGGQITRADSSLLLLQADVDVLERVELRGRANIETPEAAPGALERMSAASIDLDYAPDGQTLERAALSGDAAIGLAGASGGGGRRLQGQALEMAFGEDGATMTALDARGRVRLDLPADGSAPARVIQAAALTASGPESGIDRTRFEGGVEFHELGVAGGDAEAADRVVRARTLEARTAPGFGDIERATFTGDAVLEEGTGREGRAEQVEYQVAAGRATLASPGRRGAGARVSDERGAVEAETIDIALGGDTLVATGGVRSVLRAHSGGDRRERPAIFSDDEPVNVTADRLESQDGVGSYTGSARLWQGANAHAADALTLDEGSGNLAGEGNVVSTIELAAEDDDDRSDGSRAQPTTIRAGSLDYQDAERRATYTGSPAHMVGPEGDLQARQIELYLDEAGRRLERLEGYDDVSIETTTRSNGATVPRHGTGGRLTYFAAEERYVMRGGHVVVLEQLPKECRETIGSVLTFYRSTDTITVDASAGKRPQTVSGGKCPERRD